MPSWQAWSTSPRAGEQLRVRLPAGAQVPDLENASERLAAFLGVREVRITRDPANARYARVVVLRRDPLADPTPIPWPLAQADRCSLWAPIPVGEDEDGTRSRSCCPSGTFCSGPSLVAASPPSLSSSLPLPPWTPRPR
jgi:hypothetical protein